MSYAIPAAVAKYPHNPGGYVPVSTVERTGNEAFLDVGATAAALITNGNWIKNCTKLKIETGNSNFDGVVLFQDVSGTRVKFYPPVTGTNIDVTAVPAGSRLYATDADVYLPPVGPVLTVDGVAKTIYVLAGTLLPGVSNDDYRGALLADCAFYQTAESRIGLLLGQPVNPGADTGFIQVWGDLDGTCVRLSTDGHTIPTYGQSFPLAFQNGFAMIHQPFAVMSWADPRVAGVTYTDWTTWGDNDGTLFAPTIQLSQPARRLLRLDGGGSTTALGVANPFNRVTMGTGTLTAFNPGRGVNQIWTTAGVTTLAGIEPGYDGESYEVYIAGTNSLTISNEDASVTSLTPINAISAGSTFTAAVGDLVRFTYDATLARWRARKLN